VAWTGRHYWPSHQLHIFVDRLLEGRLEDEWSLGCQQCASFFSPAAYAEPKKKKFER
jgi:hypothetical protein